MVGYHGYISDPPGRQVVANYGDKMSLSNGGAKSSKWDVCGFAGDGKKWTTAGTAKTLSPGTYKVQSQITANHGGRLSVGLCKADDPSACWKNRLKINGQDVYYYLTDSNPGVKTFNIEVPNVKCDNCILQWLYEAMQSCAYPGYDNPTNDADSKCVWGGENSTVEVFTNCSDVKITGSGSLSIANNAGSNPVLNQKAGGTDTGKASVASASGSSSSSTDAAAAAETTNTATTTTTTSSSTNEDDDDDGQKKTSPIIFLVAIGGLLFISCIMMVLVLIL
jgi:hypothetical protein